MNDEMQQALNPNQRQFIIDLDIEGGVTLRDALGIELDFAAYAYFGELLTSEKRRRRKVGLIAELQLLLPEIQWSYPVPRPDLSKRKQYPRQNCVYFMRASSKPNLIKIGQSIDLAGRMVSHRSMYGDDAVIIAIGEHNRYAEIEEMLHVFFEDYKGRMKGTNEWFDADVVLTWLKAQGYPYAD